MFAIKRVLIFILLFSSCQIAYAKTYKVGAMVDIFNTGFAPFYKELQDEVKAVVGQDAAIEFPADAVLVNDFDVELARTQYQKLLDRDVDIILAFGPTTNEVISAQSKHAKPTILFSAINIDLVDVDTSRTTSGINNFTYILAPWTFEKDLQDFRTLYNFRKVAVLGASGPWNTKNLRDNLDQTFAKLNAEYETVAFESIEQLSQDLDGFDAVYMSKGFNLLPETMQRIADLLIQLKLPSFTTNLSDDVQNGWLATNNTDANYQRLIRRVALGVEAVASGENLANRPVGVDLADSITVNYNTAEKIGLPIRYSQIATLNLIGSFDEVVYDKRYTIQEAIETALHNNLNLQASQLNVELSEQNVALARSSYYPDLNASISGTKIDPDLARLAGGSNPENTISGSATLSQLLFSEDSSAAISAQRYLSKADAATHRVNQLDTVLATSRAAFDVLRLRNALQSQTQNLEITNRNLAVAQQNYEAGQEGKGDILRFQSEKASNMQSVINAINALRQGQNALNVLLNVPISQRTEIKDVTLKNSNMEPHDFSYERLSRVLDDPSEQLVFEDFLLLKAMEISPELIALDFNLKAVERNIAQYGWRRYLPDVSARAQYNEVFDRSGVGVPDPNVALDDDYNVGLVLSFPLFNRNQDNVNKRIAKKQKQQLEFQIASQRQVIENNIRNAVLDLSSRTAEIELSRVSEKAALESLGLTEASYATGAATVTELIDSQTTYLQAQLASANALYNFIDSALGLERSIGTFVVLKSPVISRDNIGQQYLEYRQQKGFKEPLQ